MLLIVVLLVSSTLQSCEQIGAADAEKTDEEGCDPILEPTCFPVVLDSDKSPVFMTKPMYRDFSPPGIAGTLDPSLKFGIDGNWGTAAERGGHVGF